MTFNPYTERPSRLELGALAAILILAAVLRMGAPGIVEFKQDEANLSLLALDMTHGHGIPLLGIDSSVGIRNAPINVYLLAVPYLFTSDPITATQYIGLLNVIAVLLTYLLARRYYGSTAALIAALVYAASPWAVVYSRKIWAQEMLPPFVLLTIGTALLGFVERKRWAQWLHLPLLAFTGQIHYAAFVLVPITGFLLLVGLRRKTVTRAFWLSMIPAVLIIAPFIVGAAQATLLNPEVISRAFSGSGGSSNATSQEKHLALTGEAFHYALLTIGGSEIHSFTGEEGFERYLATMPPAYPVFDLIALSVFAAAIYLVWRSVRFAIDPGDARAAVDIVWVLLLIGAPLAFSVTWTPVYTHYMIPIFPAAYIILGAGVAALFRALPRAIQYPVLGWLGFTVSLQIWFIVGLFSFLSVNATSVGGFGTPLAYLMPIRARILSQKPAEVLANLGGQFIGYNPETSVWNVLLYDVPLRRFEDQNITVYPPQDVVYLTNNCDSQVANAEVFPLRVKLDGSGLEGCYALSHRTPADYPAAQFTALSSDQPAALENGARVIAYRWQTDSACLDTVWRTEHPASGPNTDFFSTAVHFINAKGEKILDADAAFWNGRYWRAGDTIVRRFCLPDPAKVNEIAGARLGLYTYEDTPEGRKFYNVNTVDAAGAIIGQEIELTFK